MNVNSSADLDPARSSGQGLPERGDVAVLADQPPPRLILSDVLRVDVPSDGMVGGTAGLLPQAEADRAARRARRRARAAAALLAQSSPEPQQMGEEGHDQGAQTAVEVVPEAPFLSADPNELDLAGMLEEAATREWAEVLPFPLHERRAAMPDTDPDRPSPQVLERPAPPVPPTVEPVAAELAQAMGMVQGTLESELTQRLTEIVRRVVSEELEGEAGQRVLDALRQIVRSEVTMAMSLALRDQGQ